MVGWGKENEAEPYLLVGLGEALSAVFSLQVATYTTRFYHKRKQESHHLEKKKNEKRIKIINQMFHFSFSIMRFCLNKAKV